LDPTTLPGSNPPTALAVSTTAPINWDSPFTLYTLLYTPSVNQAVSIFFNNYLGSDWVGPVIDNVSLVNLTAVPLPASVWLMLSGMLVLMLMARRQSLFGGGRDATRIGSQRSSPLCPRPSAGSACQKKMAA